MTTTQQIIEKSSRLKVYENLYIKRRFNEGYEAEWFDITCDILASSNTTASQRLDFDNYGYGQFITGSAQFKLNNKEGNYAGTDDMYSYFSGAITRHYTKVLYKVGYYDEDSDKIDEQTFYGLLNEKTAKDDYEKGEFSFSALSLNQILAERSVLGGVLSGALTVTEVITRIMADTTITSYINFDVANVNPALNFTFDDATVYENTKVSEALNEICLRVNSIWYIDTDNNFIVADRVANDNIAFLFKGGNSQTRATNIVKIEKFEAGYGKIINEVVFDDGATISQYLAASDNLQKYGTNSLPIEGEDITTESIKLDIATNILADHAVPKKKIILTTVYMPNVLNYFDRCVIDYKPKINTFGKNILVWNGGTNFNDDYYWGSYDNRLIILPDRYYLYYGYEHNIKQGITKHYLVEGAVIGQGISPFVWNLGNWNNTEYWNASTA